MAGPQAHCSGVLGGNSLQVPKSQEQVPKTQKDPPCQ